MTLSNRCFNEVLQSRTHGGSHDLFSQFLIQISFSYTKNYLADSIFELNVRTVIIRMFVRLCKKEMTFVNS